MEILIGLLAVAVLGGIWYFNRNKGFDANQDGKVDLKDVKPVVENTVEAVKQAVDTNNDGKVTVADAKEAVSEVKEAVKSTVKKAAKPKAAKKPATAKAGAKPKKPKMTVVK